MKTNKKPTTEPVIKPKQVVEIAVRKDDNPDVATSAILTRPEEVQAAVTIQQWQGLHEVNALAKTLSLQITEVNNGNMQRAYRRETATSCELHLRLAFKAQNQCRMTLETLSNIKNPPFIYAKQANISNGHQQVNNGTPTPVMHAKEIKNPQNELLEHTHGERLDTRATGEAIGINSDLEAVE
jgi:hypothetical protein